MFKEKFANLLHSMAYKLDSNIVDTVPTYKGEVFWELSDNGQVVSSGHKPNIVTQDAGILLAMLMKTGNMGTIPTMVNYGIFGLAVGYGDTGWDPLSPPLATKQQRSLFSEISRKRADSITFINSDGQISTSPTNIIDIKTIFLPAEATGAIMELGLLGGNVSSNVSEKTPVLPANGPYDVPHVDVTNRNILINYVTIPVINKGPTSTLTWTWRLTF